MNGIDMTAHVAFVLPHQVVEVMEAVGASERVLELLAAPPASQVCANVWLLHPCHFSPYSMSSV